jgi:murein DD-endopeptidase MepM/ murein hydrolase activator NlpD
LIKKILLFTLLLTLTAAVSLHSSVFTVGDVRGSVRFISEGGKELRFRPGDSFDSGVTVRTFRNSSLSLHGEGYHYRIYQTSYVRFKTEPQVVYGKLARSTDEHFIDLRFYFFPKPAQGKTLKVIMLSNGEDVEARCKLVDDGGSSRELSMYHIEDGKYRALTGFDCATPAVRYRLHMTASKNATYTQVVYPFYLQETSFQRGRVMLPTEKETLFRDSDRKRREIEYLMEILSRSGSEALWNGTFDYPLEKAEIISAFGKRRTYYLGNRMVRIRHHRGIDFRAPRGTAVFAPNHGRVALARDRVTTGYTLVIDHGQNVFSLFFHLDSVAVSEGTFVQQGDLVGESGSTGIAAGPHLHWGLYIDGVYVDPEDWIQLNF